MPLIFLFFISFVLGSIPFGYIFSKLFGKNILEIGWKKTSASNVFKNVGFLPGLLTAIFDIGKGSLAVFLAQKLNFPLWVQALCGLFAVLGHNWSIFLKGAGGRGIGTFFGAFLILAPKIALFSFFPFIVLAIIWDSSIATIFFLFFSIFLSFRENVLFSIGLLPLISLFPIFLKRLSPLKEISLSRPKLIINRLLFDDDEFHSEWRIKKIIKRLTKRENLEK